MKRNLPSFIKPQALRVLASLRKASIMEKSVLRSSSQVLDVFQAFYGLLVKGGTGRLIDQKVQRYFKHVGDLFGCPHRGHGLVAFILADSLAGGFDAGRPLPGRYDSLPTGPADVNNFSYQGRPVSQMNPYERDQLSKIMKQAYRMNGTTYQGR